MRRLCLELALPDDREAEIVAVLKARIEQEPSVKIVALDTRREPS